ncbi:glycosyltransferase [Cohnella sp. GCM10027633]|uniref:glycosyltransferase n=1 Tax=unclassified Cohnella TaxID=2636738 RepID=UPI00363B16E7
MNVLYLNNYMLADAIERRGNESTFSQAANNKIDQVKAAIETNGHRVRMLSSGLTNNRSFRWHRGFRSELNQDLHYAGIFDLPLLNIITSIASMCYRVFKLHRASKIDYLIFWNYKPEVAVVAYLCKLLLGIKIILDYEDGYFAMPGMKGKRKVINKIESFVKNKIDGAILVSPDLVPRVEPKPFYVFRGLANPAMLDHSLAAKRDKAKGDDIVLMYSGGLDHERGIDVLVEALKYTRESFSLVITGRGPLAKILNADADPRIRYLGYLDYESAKRHMREADILINTQRETIDFAFASFPSKIFDYLATDRLIVSSNVGNMRAFSEGAFYIYEKDDPKQLAAAIDKAIGEVADGRSEHKLALTRSLRDKLTPALVGKGLIAALMKDSTNAT